MTERRRALLVATIALALASALVAVRVAAVDFGGFVAAGSVNAVDASVFTYDHAGYDGQFFYRLALEPFSTSHRVDGIAFDAPAYRQQRIGYPLIAFLVAAVTPVSTTQALVLVNVAALGMMTFFAARIAQYYGRSPIFALVLLAWPAFIFSLGLNLSEIVAVAFALGGVRFALIGRHGTAVALFCVAALTRETTALMALASLVVYRKWIYAWVIGVLGVWQVAVWAMWRELPGLTSLPAPGERLLGLPFVGLVESTGTWFVEDLAIFVSLLIVVWIGTRHFQRGSVAGVALIGYVVLAACLGSPVWNNWRGFSRATVELVAVVFVLRLHEHRKGTASRSPQRGGKESGIQTRARG